MPKISVIIPTYNRKHLLAKTIESIIHQSFKSIEIIIVDDHSTDGTYEWLEKNYRNKVKLCKNDNRGPGAARNTGLLIAKGDYIQFFDSDDLLSIDKLEVQHQLLQGKTDTFVYGPYAMATAPPDDWKLTDAIIQYAPLPDDNLLKWIYRGWCSITQACLFPRVLIEKVGPWREDIHTHEDREYWYRLAREINSSPIHENISCTIYRQHNDQLTLKTERQLQRSTDSLKVDEDMLYNNIEIDFWSKVLLKARINATKAYINTISTQNAYKSNLIYTEIHRISNKIQRLMSRNNWERMHGASTDSRLFEKYIQKVP